VQAASRVEERTWERNLDTQLQKLLKTNHQDSIDAALNVLFKGDLAVYDVLMDGVEAVSESSTMTEQANDGAEVTWQALLVAAPILAWTRFSIASGTIPHRHPEHAVGALLGPSAGRRHEARDGADPVLDRPAAAHPRRDLFADPQAGPAAHKGASVKPAAPGPDASQFLADTRYLLVAVVAPVGAPLFRWQEPQHHINFEAERENRCSSNGAPRPPQRRAPAAGLRRRAAAAGSVLRGLPRGGQG
jgi:hypothetical protein